MTMNLNGEVMMSNVAYYSACTEYEAGWGCRPDGYIVSLSKEFLVAKVEELNSRPRGAYGHDVYEKPKLCVITEEFAKKISESEGGYLHAPNNHSSWLVDQ